MRTRQTVRGDSSPRAASIDDAANRFHSHRRDGNFEFSRIINLKNHPRREIRMNAAVVHKLGEPPRCESFPEPVAGDNEVLVEVRAASLKPVDKQVAGGTHYASPSAVPFIC